SGNIDLIAFDGTENNGFISTAGGTPIRTARNGAGSNGKFLAMSGRVNTTGFAPNSAILMTGIVNTTGGATGTGSVELLNTIPNTSTAVTISKSNAAITSGDFHGGALGAQDINTLGITTDGATITVR